MPRKKSGIPEIKYMSHSSKNFFGKRSDQQYIKEGLGGGIGNRADSVEHYNKSGHKWKKYIKSLKNKNKMIFSIDMNSISRRKLNNIKNTKAKVSKNHRYSISDGSSSDSDSDSSLSSDIE